MIIPIYLYMPQFKLINIVEPGNNDQLISQVQFLHPSRIVSTCLRGVF